MSDHPSIEFLDERDHRHIARLISDPPLRRGRVRRALESLVRPLLSGSAVVAAFLCASCAVAAPLALVVGLATYDGSGVWAAPLAVAAYVLYVLTLSLDRAAERR